MTGTLELPLNEAAEQALLGCILVNPAALDRDGVADLEPGHFANPVHGQIFEAARKLAARGQKPDAITLRSYFESNAALEPVGGAGYLGRLAAVSAGIINAEAYARAVRFDAMRRDMIYAAQDVAELAAHPPPEMGPEALYAEAEGMLSRVGGLGPQGDGMVTLDHALREGLEGAEAAYKADGRVLGVTTGLVDLDRATGGLHPADLIIIAGRPASGKTSLATGMALAAATAEIAKARASVERGEEAASIGTIAFFSLEMSGAQLAQRIIGGVTGISADRVRGGRIGPLDFGVMVNAVDNLAGLPLMIDATALASITQMRQRLRRLARSRPLRMIVVDYLQLMAPTTSRRDANRVQEVTEITRGLKLLAKEFAVPVVALSQLSRAVEAREDHRPTLADLRESGSIEQDADIVAFVYRDEYYVAQREPRRNEKQTEATYLDQVARWNQRMDEVRGIAEVIIAKQRQGPTRTVRLRFDAERTQFQNLAADR